MWKFSKAKSVPCKASQRWDAPPEHQFLLSFWYGEANEAGLVPKAKVNPFELKDILPNLLLLEAEQDSEWCFRLVGTGIVSQYKEDFTGRSLSDVRYSSCMNVYRTLANTCRTNHRPHVCVGTMRYNEPLHLKTTKTVIPVTKDGETVSHCLIALTLDDKSEGLDHAYEPSWPAGAQDALYAISLDSAQDATEWYVKHMDDLEYSY